MISRTQLTVIAVLLLVVASGFAGWWAQGKNLRLEISEANAARLEATREKEASDRRWSATVANWVLEDLQAEAATTQTVKHEVERYEETRPSADRCSLDPEWVRIHDHAAGLPRPTDATGLPDGAGASTPAGADDADALRTVTANYDTCRAQLAKARGWHVWYCGLAPGDPRCE